MSIFRTSFLCAFLLSLTACGAGGAQDNAAASPVAVTIGGTLSGFPQGDTLLLKNGDAETIAISSNGSFVFNKRVPAGTDYNVSILGQPSGVNCSVANGAGKADASANPVSNISISCTPTVIALIKFYVGVSVSGLAQGNAVTFTNNGSDTVTATDNGLFVFPATYASEGVYSGQTGGYAVAVQTNPRGQTCSLTNASGADSPSQNGDFVNVLAVCK